MPLPENPEKWISATEEVPPGHVGQSVCAELQSQHFLLIRLLLLASQHYFPGFFILVHEVFD